MKFKVSETADRDEVKKLCNYDYPDMQKAYESTNFSLDVKAGDFTDSEIIVILGENGTGKTTFVRMLSGAHQPDNECDVPKLNVSYKPQKVSPSFPGTVRQLFHAK